MKKSFSYKALVALVAIACEFAHLEPDQGGYLCRADVKPDGSWETPRLVRVGNIERSMAVRCMKYALEKVLRIIEFFLKTSFEMRSEEKKQWGGGIRYRDTVSSFSRFDEEEIDEATALIFTIHCYYRDDKEKFRQAFNEELRRHRHFQENKFLPAMFNKFYNTL